ncbi:MAG: STM4015 family protein [Thermosynechococcaceae cyanobacterium]
MEPSKVNPQGTDSNPVPQPQWNLRERLQSNGNSQHATRFANREVHEFQPGQPLANPQQFAIAVRDDSDWDDPNPMHTFNGRLDALLSMPEGSQIEALIIGLWSDGEGVCTGGSSAQSLVETLVSQCDRLPHLKSLFIGDIEYMECEISWLVQSDMSPVLRAYPQLELLQVRGGNQLEFKPVEGDGDLATPALARHDHLTALILETGGLSRETVHQIYQWDFPALTHLELWFGSENYGGDCWDRDLPPLLEDLVFPTLTYLGLRNSQFADEIVEMLVRSPLLANLQVLDLSLGTLSDAGAAQLLDCPAIRNLAILNVSESYLSDAMIDQLRSLDIEVIAEGQRQEEDEEDPADRRYCVVAE